MYFKKGANYLLLHNKVSQKLAAQNIYQLTVDQECRNSLLGGSLRRLQCELPGPVAHPVASQLTHMVVCRTHFLKASLVSLPHGSLHRASPSEQAVKISARKQEGKEKGTQEGHHHLLELHPRSDTLRFSHILFFRRKSPGPAHSQEQDMTQACDCQDVGSLAVCLRSLPARPHTLLPPKAQLAEDILVSHAPS